jgi:hypothetical protein
MAIILDSIIERQGVKQSSLYCTLLMRENFGRNSRIGSNIQVLLAFIVHRANEVLPSTAVISSCFGQFL